MSQPRHIHSHPVQPPEGTWDKPGPCSCGMPHPGWPVPSSADLAEAGAVGKRLAAILGSGEREALARLGAAAGSAR